jgi:hypothetical protein
MPVPMWFPRFSGAGVKKLGKPKKRADMATHEVNDAD